jgi:hypothetical protein
MPSRSFEGQGHVSSPYTRGYVVTTHNTNPLSYNTRAVYIGGAGNITGRLVDDTADVLITGLLVGNVYHFAFSHIRATGTTATLIVALD